VDAPTDNAVLEAWERGASGHLEARVIALLGLDRQGASDGALLSLPLGQRNAALLRLHEVIWGPRLECVLECPACAALSELSVEVSQILVGPGADPAEGFLLQHGDITLRYRLPNTADLAAALSAGSVDAARRVVVSRCVVGLDPEAPLTDGAVLALSEGLTEVDPMAELSFVLSCFGCGERWSAQLDPVDFVWRELEARGRELMAEVDALARAYRWSERDILALTPTRRRAYLAMVGA